MATVKDMLATYPADVGDVDRERPAHCTEECIACAQACTAWADACLPERSVGDLTRCIRTDMDRAGTGNATAVASFAGGRARGEKRAGDVGVRPVWRDTSAPRTPACTSTAACAPKPAAPANRHATSSSGPSPDRLRGAAFPSGGPGQRQDTV
ncbi:four-helix bundle copper-binding protein [Streptomyces xantholiticus]|uniref:four-helix bundle copper-binding protein n=1 Tax=Streptomyces xantholiticus TaxID=68285 RepID=UPI001991CF03|nr:hypothetical protein GCM10010381_68300 [Streptomyces xantholiticus]